MTITTHNGDLIHFSFVQEYEADELLVVYDPPFKYGQNFYICLTEEAKERHLNVSTFFNLLKYCTSNLAARISYCDGVVMYKLNFRRHHKILESQNVIREYRSPS